MVGAGVAGAVGESAAGAVGVGAVGGPAEVDLFEGGN